MPRPARSFVPCLARCPRVLTLLVVLATAGCSAGVNEDIAGTSTPFPLRSPVVAGDPSPAPIPAGPLATAASLLDGGDLTPAAPLLDRAVAAGEGDPDALALRARARTLAGDVPGALADLEAAVVLAPDRADLVLARAEARGRLGQPGALADFDRAVALAPGDARAYAARAAYRTAQAAGDPAAYDAALADYVRALALDPTLGAALVGPARVYADRAEFRGDPADWERAVAELDRLLDLGRDPELALLRARVVAGAGDPAGARAALDRAGAALGEGAPPAHRAAFEETRAAVALSANDFGQAAEAARAALALDGSRRDAARLLPLAELRREDPRAALAAAEALLARFPDDGPGLYLRGRARAESGDPAARADLERAAAALPHSPVYAVRIATVLDALAVGTPTPG